MTMLIDLVRAEWKGAGGTDYWPTEDDTDIALDMMANDYRIYRYDPTIQEMVDCVAQVRAEDIISYVAEFFR
jgi:hypothetical protein